MLLRRWPYAKSTNGHRRKKLVVRALEADWVLTNKTVLSAAVIGQLPKLRYIGVLATGYNVVNAAAARARRLRLALSRLFQLCASTAVPGRRAPARATSRTMTARARWRKP
ncbi:MAG: hypothetical protein WCG76_02770 [Verrucomicrobiota bacterium]